MVVKPREEPACNAFSCSFQIHTAESVHGLHPQKEEFETNGKTLKSELL